MAIGTRVGTFRISVTVKVNHIMLRLNDDIPAVSLTALNMAVQSLHESKTWQTAE